MDTQTRLVDARELYEAVARAEGYYNNPSWAYRYARWHLGLRFPEGEAAIASDPEYAFLYAGWVIRGRFPEGEAAIASDPEYAYLYAYHVIRDPWPEGETAVASDPRFAYRYATDFHGGYWPKGESAIMREPGLAYTYALKNFDGRWYEAEPYILKDRYWATKYARDVIQGRWPELEEEIITSPSYAVRYAKRVIRDRWPEAEPYIQDTRYWPAYYSTVVEAVTLPKITREGFVRINRYLFLHKSIDPEQYVDDVNSVTESAYYQRSFLLGHSATSGSDQWGGSRTRPRRDAMNKMELLGYRMGTTYLADERGTRVLLVCDPLMDITCTHPEFWGPSGA
jgi:hypothetical protein